VIHLVCYSQSATERERFKDVFPPALSTMIFEKENLLVEFLNHLKIPTQIILDLETFQGDLQTFLRKNDFHHTICFQTQSSYQQSMETLKYGALLVDSDQLHSLQWWWNRTTIESSKVKGESLPQRGLIAGFSPLNRTIEKSWGQAFTEYCHASSQDCAVRTVSSLLTHTPQILHHLQQSYPQLSTLVLTDLDKIFPRDLRALIALLYQWSLKHSVRIVLDLQSSQVLFESILDWNTMDNQSGLYRLQCNRNKMIHKSSFVGMTAIFSQPMTLEYVRYTWLAGHKLS